MIWTAAEDEKLSRLILKRRFVRGDIPNIWNEVSTHFEGHSPAACKQHWHIMQRRAAGKPAKDGNSRVANSRRTHKEIAAALRQQPAPPPQPLFVPLRVAVAMITGDPLPGRSVLDRMRAGELAPPKGMSLPTGPLR